MRTRKRYKTPPELEGLPIGRLVMLKPDGGGPMWQCQCACGKLKQVSYLSVLSGATTSCGCYRTERQTKHGMSHHPSYKVWDAMRSRCYRKNNPHYKNYGGRGIVMCAGWKTNFANFWKDMGPSYKAGLELDRVDNNGDYTKENCQWVTHTQNNRNKRGNRLVKTPWGAITIAELAERTGIAYKTLQERARKGKGWPDISNLPKRRTKKL
jgi:hypothetical protein